MAPIRDVTRVLIFFAETQCKSFHSTATKAANKTELSNSLKSRNIKKERHSQKSRKKGISENEELNKSQVTTSKPTKSKLSPIKTDSRLDAGVTKSDTLTASDFGEQTDITKGILSEEEELLTLKSLDRESHLCGDKNITGKSTEARESHFNDGEELLEKIENVLGNDNAPENGISEMDDAPNMDVQSDSKIDNTSWWRREDTIGGRLFEARTMAEIDGFLSVGQVM